MCIATIKSLSDLSELISQVLWCLANTGESPHTIIKPFSNSKAYQYLQPQTRNKTLV